MMSDPEGAPPLTCDTPGDAQRRKEEIEGWQSPPGFYLGFLVGTDLPRALGFLSRWRK